MATTTTRRRADDDAQLETAERDRLAELETVIERGKETFVEVVNALTEIHDSRLYRQTHRTFAAYLWERWHISRSRGYQYIHAARVSTVVDIQNEAQARKLTSDGRPRRRTVRPTVRFQLPLPGLGVEARVAVVRGYLNAAFDLIRATEHADDRAAFAAARDELRATIARIDALLNGVDAAPAADAA